MNDRVVSLASALAAVFVLFALLFGTASDEPTPLGTPITVDRQARGLALVHAWLEARGEQVHSLRSRYSDLAKNFPGGGNLLISVLPHTREAQRNESAALKDWLSQGNSILVLLRPPDTGQLATIGSSTQGLRRLTGLEFVVDDEEADEGAADEMVSDEQSVAETGGDLNWQDALDAAFSDPVATVLTSGLSTHPLVGGVDQIVSLVPPQPVIRLRGLLDGELQHVSGSGAVLAIMHVNAESIGAALPQTPVPAAWLDVRDDARFIVVNLAYPFSNGALRQADNARFLANIVESSLNRNIGRRGQVIFDDMHQGLSELYDEDAFFSDHRLRNTLWLLFGCWLLYVLGSNNRLPGMMRPVPKKPRPADLIEVTGGFLANREDPRDSAERMFAHFFRLTGDKTVSNGLDQFAHLERSQRLPQAPVAELKNLYLKLQQGNKIDLRHLHRLMLGIRKKLI